MGVRITERFERLAFECQLREHPGDDTAALVFTDWLCEHGYKLLGAKRLVSKLRREAMEEKQRERIEKLMDADGEFSTRLRRWVRASAGAHTTNLPIQVSRGGQRPHIVGYLGYWSDPDSGFCVKGMDDDFDTSGLVWIESSPRSVVVGAAFVANQFLIDTETATG